MMDLKNKLMPQISQADSAYPLPKAVQKKGSDSADAEFDGALAQANAAAMSLTATVPATPAQEQIKPVEVVQGEAAQNKLDVNPSDLSGQKVNPNPTSDSSNLAPVFAPGVSPSVTNGMSNGSGVGAQMAGKAATVQTQALPVSSTNTGALNAGLNPWSSDWVLGSKGASKATLVNSTASPGSPKPGDSARGGQAIEAGNDSVASYLSAMSLMQGVGGEMNGEIEGIELDAPKGSEAGKPQGLSYTGLSGGEFLNALNGVRQGDTQSGQSFGQSGQGQGQASRNPFQVVEGGLKGEMTAKPSLPSKSKILGSEAQDFSAHLGQAHQPAGNSQLAGISGVLPTSVELSGHVTRNGVNEQRLSSEALAGMSSNIRNLGTHGGGEMRIRLKPENLGELHIKVMSNGRDVSLQVQATDESAKKIIEESLTHLKESMAGQNLSLGKVDVTIAQPTTQSSQMSGEQNPSQQNGANAFGSQFGGQGSEARQEQSGSQLREGIGLSSLSNRPAARMAAAASARQMQASASGRVDLMA